MGTWSRWPASWRPATECCTVLYCPCTVQYSSQHHGVLLLSAVLYSHCTVQYSSQHHGVLLLSATLYSHCTVQYSSQHHGVLLLSATLWAVLPPSLTRHLFFK